RINGGYYAELLSLLGGGVPESDGMRPDDRQLSRLLELRSINSEFPHTVVESGAVKTQARCCSSRTTNHPTRLTQYLHNVLAFDRLEFYWTLKLINHTAICRLL